MTEENYESIQDHEMRLRVLEQQIADYWKQMLEKIQALDNKIMIRTKSERDRRIEREDDLL